jgi:branched-subunit amino acid aminotransferase/4-amino-4-deoxychorismate lyase
MPPPIRRAGAVVDLGSWRVTRADALARFKTLNYWSRRQAYQSARALGFDEVLGTTGDGGIWEGSRSNLFIVDSDSLITPDLEGPIVPGVTRALVRELAGGLPIANTTTKLLTRDDLERADEVFLTNSVRGIIPVSRIANLSWTTPGPWTQRLSMLMSDVLSFVEEKGTDQ